MCPDSRHNTGPNRGVAADSRIRPDPATANSTADFAIDGMYHQKPVGFPCFADRYALQRVGRINTRKNSKEWFDKRRNDLPIRVGMATPLHPNAEVITPPRCETAHETQDQKLLKTPPKVVALLGEKATAPCQGRITTLQSPLRPSKPATAPSRRDATGEFSASPSRRKIKRSPSNR